MTLLHQDPSGAAAVSSRWPRRTAPPRRRRTARPAARTLRHAPWTGWLFVAPHLLLFVTFIAWPFLLGLWISLHDWDFFRVENPFVGLGNYQDLLDPGGLYGELYWDTLRNTLTFVALSVPTLVVAGLGLALLFNARFRGRVAFRAVVLFPWTLSVAVTSVLWWNLLNETSGMVPRVLESLGITSPAFLSSMPWAWVSILLATVWWTVGFNAVVLLAGLQNVPEQLLDAARIDGANAWQRLRFVVLPALRPVLLLVTTLQVFASFNMVGQSQLITGGGPPPRQTTPVLQYIYETGFTGRYEVGPAAAMSVVTALLMLAISLVNFRVAREQD